MQASQRQAAQFVASVMAGRSLDEEQLRAGQTPDSGGQLRDLTLGTLRHLGELRARARRLAARRIDGPGLEALLCVALYQLRYTQAAPHAIVDQAVGTCRAMQLSHAAGFLNAVLRRAVREGPSAGSETDDPEARWSHPGWWVERLHDQYGARAEEILAAGLSHPPMAVRPNRHRNTAEAYRAELDAAGIASHATANGALLLDTPVPVRRLPGFAEGRVSVQDAGAQWAAPMLDLAPGQRVLDACAAPGGKACHILETADVELLALDRDARRLDVVRSQWARLGLSGRAQAADASEPATWWDGKPFDRILLDAPCSGSGIVRRHPDAKWLRRPGDLAAFAAQQGKLLDALWQVLAPGGKLLYVTCSVFAEENAGVVEAFQQRCGHAHRLPLPGFLSEAGQLLPGAEHDGFFYALLREH